MLLFLIKKTKNYNFSPSFSPIREISHLLNFLIISVFLYTCYQINLSMSCLSPDFTRTYEVFYGFSLTIF